MTGRIYCRKCNITSGDVHSKCTSRDGHHDWAREEPEKTVFCDDCGAEPGGDDGGICPVRREKYRNRGGNHSTRHKWKSL